MPDKQPKTWNDRFRFMKKTLGHDNAYISDKSGNTTDSVKSMTQPSKELSRTMKYAIVVFEETLKLKNSLLKKRTKISKDSLLSIGCKHSHKDYYYYEVQENLNIDVKLNPMSVRIVFDTDDQELERTLEYIDEITTLLTGLTGKTDFHK